VIEFAVDIQEALREAAEFELRCRFQLWVK
jgi:hypothetical protein